MSENMKPSDIAWIGDIPESWDVKSLKYISDCNQKVIRESTSPIYTFNYIDIGSVTFEKGIGELEELRFEDAPSRARRVVANGDTIISTVRTYLKAIAYVNNSENMIASTGFAVYTPDKMLFPKHLYYFCISEGFVQEVDKFSYGIAYPAINTEVLSRIVVAYPKLTEQTLIANFLDEQCEKIDSIVADIEKQIEVLQKYKKSLITETVTKGLDKSVPMKDSNIEWIGQIPEHWEVKRLKFLGTARNGLTYDPNDISEYGKKVLRSMNVQNGKLDLENYINVDKSISPQLLLQINDLLICSRNGSKQLIGKCALIDERVVGESYGAFMCVYRSQYNRFLYYVLQSHIFDLYVDTFVTSTINQLTNENLGNIKISFTTSIAEQTKIANYLDQQCLKIDSIIESKKEQLTKITQHKKSLIYEYVTGKKRVKEAQYNGN